MGKREFGSGKPGEEDDQKIYTDPDMAKEFVEQTGIDALACSFGTTHGIYLTEPKLNFDIVSGVREKTEGVPVVMHGGSGVSKEDFHKAIKAGVRKINYFTYMDKAGGTATEEYVESVEKGETGILFISQSSRLCSNERKCKRGNKDIFYDRLRIFDWECQERYVPGIKKRAEILRNILQKDCKYENENML